MTIIAEAVGPVEGLNQETEGMLQVCFRIQICMGIWEAEKTSQLRFSEETIRRV